MASALKNQPKNKRFKSSRNTLASSALNPYLLSPFSPHLCTQSAFRMGRAVHNPNSSAYGELSSRKAQKNGGLLLDLRA